MPTSGTQHCRDKERVFHRLCRALNKDHGQALVELALAVSLLTLILVGAVEFSRLAYASIEVSNAARAGVSYGAQSITTAADTTGIQTAAQNDASELTLGTTTATTSCICSDGTASTCAAGDCSTSNIERILTVNTQATIDPGFHLPGMASTYTLHGKAIQKVLP
ncbi:MAG: TadE family protein [Terracidiphilus sp.]